MNMQDYLNEECKRIKRDLLKEFEAMLQPMDRGLASIQQDLNELERLCSFAHVFNIIEPKNDT